MFGLLLMLAMAPGTAAPAASPHQPPAALCAVAQDLARRPPCLDAAGCGSYQEFRQLFGEPEVELLRPELASPPPGPGRLGPGDRGRRSPRPESAVCPAGPEP